MSADAQGQIASPQAPAPVPVPVQAQVSAQGSRERWYQRWPRRLLTGIGAVLFCATPLTAIVVLGWLLRVMQRRILRHWWRRRGETAAGLAEADFLHQQDGLDLAVSPARLILGDRLLERLGQFRHTAAWRWPFLVARIGVGGLGANLRRGLGGFVAVFLWTLPATGLWAVAWFSGWETSFHKVYEQHSYGMLTGFCGILLFMGLMLYLPMAQAHQAAAGDWLAFFQLRTVRALVWRRAGATLALAIGYALWAVPVNVMVMWPLVVGVQNPEVASMSQAELLQMLRGHGLRTACLALPGYVLLRLAAARIYAGAMLALLASEPGRVQALPPALAATLRGLGHVPEQPTAPAALPVRSGLGAWRLACLGAAMVVWLSVASQVFVVEFLNYHGPRGWLNQPMIHLPWCTYIPPALQAR